MKISVVIPAYNEEARIGNVLDSIAEYFSKKESLAGEYEIIVVVNGSSDRTAEIVADKIAALPGIRIVDVKERIGKGGAVIKGFEASLGDVVGFTDSDRAVGPAEIYRLADWLSKSDLDGVIGSRRVKGAIIPMKQSWIRRSLSWWFNLLVDMLFNLGFKDTQCGVKFFKRRTINGILPEIKTRGYEFDVELLWVAKKKGFKIAEMPITWSHQGGSKFGFSEIPKMFFSLLKLRLRCE